MARKANTNFFASSMAKVKPGMGYGNDAVTPTTPFPTSMADTPSTPKTPKPPSSPNMSGYGASGASPAPTAAPSYTPPPVPSGGAAGPGLAFGASSAGAGQFSPYAGSSVQGGAGINDLSKIHPGDYLSLGDMVNYSGNLGNNYWQDFGPLQSMTANLYKMALSGQLPDAARILAAPELAQIQAGVKNAQGQMRDTMQGGNLQEGLSNAAQSGIQAGANAIHQYEGPLVSGATERGSNTLMSVLQSILGPAAIREFQKSFNASQNSGSLF